MSLLAACGTSYSAEGREACLQAVQQARDAIAPEEPALAFVFAPPEVKAQEVLSGTASLLGNTPLLGFSTAAPLTVGSHPPRSIVAALLAGDDLKAQANWAAGFSQDSQAATKKLLADLFPEPDSSSTLLVVGDGITGDGLQLCQNLPEGDYALGGCLSGIGLQSPPAYQLGGAQGGHGGLAAALLSGNFRVGIGTAHGWDTVGIYFRITQVDGYWLRELDNRPACEAYSQIFGHTPREWVFPPLNELVRMYPLGIEGAGDQPWQVRAPLRIEADGSFRMGLPVPEGSVGHLLVASPDSCLQAACQATQQALDALGPARPVMAIVFVDLAWKMLLEAQRGAEIAAVQEILGKHVPVAGGYTVGQIARPASPNLPAELLNQHIQVLVFGDPGPTA